MAGVGWGNARDNCDSPHHQRSALGGRHFGSIQWGRGLDNSCVDPPLLRARFQPRSGAPRCWPARGSSRGDNRVRDRGSGYLQVDARAIGTDARQLAALVRIRLCWHHRCCTTRDWGRCRCTAAVAAERSHRRHVGFGRPCFQLLGCFQFLRGLPHAPDLHSALLGRSWFRSPSS